MINPLSIVVATRNDNHGGNLISRTDSFLNSLAYKIKKFSLKNIELVIVEWNQIPSKKKLIDTIDLKNISKLCSVKVVTVSEKIHNKFKNSKKIHFFQMIAKNVGIRHSSNEFVLCTNIDIIFNDNFFKFLKNNKLEKKTIYRLSRHDLSIPFIKKFDDIDDYLDQQVIYINKMYYTLDVKKKRRYYVNSSFQRFFYLLLYMLKDHGVIYTVKRITNKIYKFNPFKIHIYLYFFFKALILKFKSPKLFTNACGDFTLLDKNSWFNLQGYDESPIYSWHIDSMFLWLAFFKKYKFYNFSDKNYIYHLNHSFGGAENIKEDLFKNLNFKKIPYFDNQKLFKNIEFYKKNKKHLVNQENWGLKDINLHVKKL